MYALLNKFTNTRDVPEDGGVFVPDIPTLMDGEMRDVVKLQEDVVGFLTVSIMSEDTLWIDTESMVFLASASKRRLGLFENGILGRGGGVTNH